MSFGQQTNDSCAFASVLSVNSSFTYDTHTLNGATSDETGCGDAEDLWFKFKVPAGGQFELQTTKYLNQYDAYARLYTGSCGSLTVYSCTGTCNYYSTTNCGTYVRVNDPDIAGDTLYIRVSNKYNFGTLDTFKIAIRELAALDVPSNDSCGAAKVLSVGSSFAYDTSSFIYAFAELTSTICGDAEDVWFKFKVPGSGLFEIQSDDYKNQYDADFVLYTGSCGSLTQYTCTGSCNYYLSSNCGSYLRVNDVGIAGDTVYVRVSNKYNFGTIDSFIIGVREILVTEIHTNDICEAATLLSVGSTFNKDTSSFVYAFVETSTSACSNVKDVWFKFKAPSSGIFEIQSDKYNNQYEAMFRLYTGTCGTLSEYGCTGSCDYYSSGNCGSYLRINDPDLSNDTIFVRVGNQYSFGTLDSFMIGVREMSSSEVVTNDSCGAALLLTVNTTFNYDTSTFKNAFAETSLSTCNDQEDVWFKFAVPSNGLFDIKSANYNNQYLPAFRIYTGTCGSLTVYDCSSNCNYSSSSNCGTYLSVFDTSLAQDTIYLRVSNFYSFGTRDSFQIAVKTIPIIRTDTGSYEVTSSCPSLSGSEWIDFTDGNDKVVFSVNPNGENLGTVCWGARIWNDSDVLRSAPDTNGNTSYLAHRNFYISPSSSPSNDASVRLYLNKNKVKLYRDSLTARGFSVGASLEVFYTDSLIISKISGSSLTSFTGGLPISVAFTVTLVDDSVLVYEFDISGFSQFIPHFTPGAPNAPLPVELVYFRGEKEQNGVRLTWITASEIDNSHFILERSQKGDKYDILAIIPSIGTSQNLLTYSYIDDEPGLFEYYKLTSVDFSGNEDQPHYIHITPDQFERQNNFVYPNPFSGALYIQSSVRNPEKIVMVDVLGQIVYVYEGSMKPDSPIVMDRNVISGIYFITVYSEQRWWSQTVVYQKP